MSAADIVNPPGLSTGSIVGIVLGGLALVIIKAVLIHSFCRRRRKRLASKREPSVQSRTSSKGEVEAFFKQLKEHEFACHDIKICTDGEGEQIQLGSGGFGRVLLGARNEHQPVAIKEMLNPDQKARKDFLNEIKLLKYVSLDANIVQYLGACVQEDHVWLVTEYMRGGDLRAALSSEGAERVSWWNGGKQIALDTARGLAFLHSRGVIHGDIKSHNILLTKEGKAKIADVGMAQIMSDDEEASSRRLQQIGTLAWAAPEILVKGWSYSEKVDIYSFGVCLWEIVTSEMPKRGQITCPSPDECPTSILSLIQECMKNDPDDRPSAKEVYRRLAASEPHTPDFGGLLDSAEGGGRRSQVAPRGPSSAGPSVPSETRSAARRSVQPFISDSPMSTHNEEVSSQAAGSVELTERLRAKSNQKSTSKKPLASQRRPSRGRKRLSEDDQAEVKVEFVPPQSYGPESPGSLVSTQSKADESDLSLTNQEILDTLPSGNTAFSDLVAKFTRFSDLPKGTVDELQDTAILSTVDADLSHIPSLHNTLENDPYMQRETSDSLDNDPNIEWLEPLPDLLRTPSQLAGDTLTSPDETEDLEKGTWPCHGDTSESGFGDDYDGDDSAATPGSVQGYAGSEMSSLSKAGDESASQGRWGPCPLHSSSSEGVNDRADLTSHHLEIPQASEEYSDALPYSCVYVGPSLFWSSSQLGTHSEAYSQSGDSPRPQHVHINRAEASEPQSQSLGHRDGANPIFLTLHSADFDDTSLSSHQ